MVYNGYYSLRGSPWKVLPLYSVLPRLFLQWVFHPHNSFLTREQYNHAETNWIEAKIGKEKYTDVLLFNEGMGSLQICTVIKKAWP